MSQSYTKPTNANSLSEARTLWNDCLDAVRSLFSGSAAPSSPVAFQSWMDSTNQWLFRRNPSNAAWVPVLPSDGRGGPLVYLSKTVLHSNAATPVTVGYLPPNFRVKSALVFVEEAFAGTSTHTISVGYSGAQTAFVNAADVSTIGKKTGASGALEQKFASAKTITALYTAGGTHTAGKAEIIVEAWIGDAIP